MGNALLLGGSVALALAGAGLAMKRDHPVHGCPVRHGIATIPAGVLDLGAGPLTVPAFTIDRTEVTNRDFQAFVAATDYVTQAERRGMGAVFVQPATLDHGIEDSSQWWRLIRGASWRHPDGPGSDSADRPDDPVVQITFADATAYARWRGGSLPTEAQWQRAAQAGNSSAAEAQAGHRPGANTWEGLFPLANGDHDGFKSRAPVGCYAPNGFGLYDMVGNVWEWTRSGSAPGPLRGGSFLCSRSYCDNAHPLGRQFQERDLPTSHAGFRLVGSAGTL